MNGKSLNITEEKLARLREIIPAAFAEGEVDWEKLRVALGGTAFKDDERVGRSFHGAAEGGVGEVGT